MHNRKIENLKELFVLKESIPVSFDDLLKSPNIEGIVSDLIFLVGYNFITYERSSDGHIKFKAGMFYDESDEKLTFDGMVLQGNLLLAVKTVYNVYVDIQLQSNIIDFYSQEMREKIIDSIILKNKIDRFFFNHLQHRMAF